MKKLFKRSLLVGVSLFALAVVAPVGVRAVSAQSEDARTTAAEKREANQTRLEDAKLRACQNRERAIKNILSRIVDRGNKQLEVFNKISERVQAFYVKKSKVLSNYDALVAEVNAKKTAAETTLQAIQDQSTEFDCAAEDPKGMVSHFKESLQAKNTALKEYKTAIKNLIVGVKSVQSTTVPAEGEGDDE